MRGIEMSVRTEYVNEGCVILVDLYRRISFIFFL